MRFNKTTLLVILCIYLFGVISGAFLNDIPNITFKKEMSLGETANFILAVFIAIYIPFFLDKKINNKRIEKDIIIQASGNLNGELYDLKKTIIDPLHVSQRIVKQSEVKTILIRTRSISNMLGLLIKNVKPYVSDKDIKKITEELENNQLTFWTDLTFNLKDKNPKITQEVYLRTEKNINTYSGNISALIMRINGF